MKVVILAGGGGTRLWPLSTRDRPKQFIDIIGCGDSLLIATIKRFLPIVSLRDIVIVTGDNYKKDIAEELQKADLEEVNVVVEPQARNTAPAIILAAAYCRDELGCADNEAIIVAPSDHVITSEDVFLEKVMLAANNATVAQAITLLGIEPDKPETGFGYLHIYEEDDEEIKTVRKFIEKPDYDTAVNYVNSGQYFWNSGLFCLTLRTLSEEFDILDKNLLAVLRKPWTIIRNDFSCLRNISFDYAVVEKASKVKAVILPACWSDVGSWAAVYDMSEKDADNNVCIGDVVAIDCQGTLFRTDKYKIYGMDLQNLLIIEHENKIVILPRDQAQRVKEFQEFINYCE